jgi:glycosyltransferase involved in cell wall biosynthesis
MLRVAGEKYLTSRTAVNISVSSSNRQTGADKIRHFQARVINNGIDRRKFDPEKSFKDIRKELAISADATLVLFIARFTAHKQPLALIKAFSEAAKRLPNLHLMLVGDGDQKAEAQEMVSATAREGKITFQPFRQDVPDILAAANIFVLPSLWEGLPIGLLEAMAMGKAVIATDVDGTKEVVQNGQNGLLVPAGDIPALTEALVSLSADRDRQQEYGRKALETVRTRFDATVMTREIEDVYYEVLSKDKAVHNTDKKVFHL